MDIYLKLLFAVLKQFFGGLWRAISNIFLGIFDTVNLGEYLQYFKLYGDELGVLGWVLAILTMLILLGVFAGIVVLCVLGVKWFVRRCRATEDREALLFEVGRLTKEVKRLSLQKEKLLTQGYGLKMPADDQESDTQYEDKSKLQAGESRFSKLTEIDRRFEALAAAEEASTEALPSEEGVPTTEVEGADASEQTDNEGFEITADGDTSEGEMIEIEGEPELTNENLTLDKLCERFRNFACNKMHLYYDIRIIRLFVAAMSSTRLIILQGISGTGKTSLPYAWGKFLKNDAQIASVQPSWRDRSELYGYFNEFTKRFNETEVLKILYEATYTDKVYAVILDEMNIAKVEYYFAEMLSILEMPSKDEWVVDLVPSGWDNDPKHIVNGRFKLPANLWYVGTANNDDSTFAISDKVYDRAIPINIDSKGKQFDAPETEGFELSAKRFDELFEEAKAKFVVSDDTLEKLTILDDYVILHLRLAFGNRIVKQLKEFIPSYIACGGTELDGLDYVLANKIFRKFESMNKNFIRDELDGLIEELTLLFGEGNMGESIAYLKRLKRL